MMEIDEWEDESQPGLIFFYPISSFIVDGITYVPPYLSGVQEEPRSMIELEFDTADDEILWMSEAASTLDHDLDD